MLIALLALLGVDLWAIISLAVLELARKRWVKRQAGAFRGAVRVASGEVQGLRPRWRRGYGRWVRDVLVWTKGPYLFLTNELVAAGGLEEQRPARTGEVKHLGDHPVVIRFRTGSATVEVAAGGDDAELLLAPYPTPVDVTVDDPSTPSGPSDEQQAASGKRP